jgi:hypothetical protein
MIFGSYRNCLAADIELRPNLCQLARSLPIAASNQAERWSLWLCPNGHNDSAFAGEQGLTQTPTMADPDYNVFRRAFKQTLGDDMVTEKVH